LGKGSAVLKVILVACMLFVFFSGFEAVFFETTYGLDIIQTVVSRIFQPLLSIFGIEIPGLSPLTPARNLEGTWKTAFPVTFYIKTDFQTFGELQDVGSENRTMTWIITGTNDENVIKVDVYFTVSNRKLVSGSGYTPDVSPMFLTGVISGTRLTLKTSDNRTIGEFNFTTDIITGTWHDHWSMVYEQEVYTQTNSLTLTRQ